MGLRHVVMFRFVEGTTAEQRQGIATALSGLPGAIPEIAAYGFGDDAGINDGNWDFAVVADFASTEDYLVYRDHPIHRAAIADHIAPVTAVRAAVQLVTG
jgi:Stress responsive A/B Barrel Domain